MRTKKRNTVALNPDLKLNVAAVATIINDASSFEIPDVIAISVLIATNPIHTTAKLIITEHIK